MIDFETYSISPDPVYGSNVKFDEDGKPVFPKSEGVELSKVDKICFECKMPTCVEDARKGCVVELMESRRKVANYEKKIEDGTISPSAKKKLTVLRKSIKMGEEELQKVLSEEL